MPQYVVESSHTKEECLEALDELKEKQPQLLQESWFGCGVGEHVSWATIDASSPSEARDKLPEFLRGKARVIEVSKFTPEQIEAFHRM